MFTNVAKIWHQLFLEERSSIGLSFFRIAVALTTAFHVIPSFFQLEDNYLSLGLKEVNESFFTGQVLELVRQSPDWFVIAFVVLFCVSAFTFLIGLFSQISCILLTLSCYYFYALNSFHIGTLSWDILLVTLVLMCITPYHGDYFSADALIRKDERAYLRPRPFFIQRLLQIQIASTFFYTALYKITARGNWLNDNPVYYLMNYPPDGVTKHFLLKDWMASNPAFCYWTGIFIVVMELLLPFLLFYPRSRRSAICLGFFFHVILILTLDVPAIFFFLFPAQMLLFIHPERVIAWINEKRRLNEAGLRIRVIFDGRCQFCRGSVQQLKVMDLFHHCDYVDFQKETDLKVLHPDLSREAAVSQLHIITGEGRLYGGFFAFRRLAWVMPMLYPSLLLMYLPFAGWIGPAVYKIIAQNRYLLHFNKTCDSNQCFRS